MEFVNIYKYMRKRFRGHKILIVGVISKIHLLEECVIVTALIVDEKIELLFDLCNRSNHLLLDTSTLDCQM